MKKPIQILLMFQLLLPLKSLTQIREVQSLNSTITVPFVFSPTKTGNKLIVEASVNGSKPMRFAVDTGANIPLILKPEIADKLNIKSHLSNLEDSDGLSFEVGTIKSLSLFDTDSQSYRQILSSGDVYIYTTAFRHADVYTGIIGLETLKKFVCEFDFDTKRLILHPQGTLPTTYQNISPLPLSFETLWSEVKIKDGAHALGSWIIDTGRWDNVAAYSLQPSFTPQASMPTAVSFLHKQLPGIKYLMENFRFGKHSVPLVEVQFAPEQQESYLGMSLLSRFNLLFDWKNKQLRLLPRKVEPLRLLTSLLDAVVIYRDGKYQVTIVTPGLPCAEAGMRVGDEILAIDGKKLEQIPSHLWHSVFYGVPGTQASILVKHPDGKEQTCTYIRESAYGVEASKGTGIGFNLVWDKGKLLVYSTRYRSPATRAGLLANDEIVNIDGVPVTTLGEANYGKALRKPAGATLQFEILRNKKLKTVNVTVGEYP